MSRHITTRQVSGIVTDVEALDYEIMVTATRTLNPLHLEDLEPRRFEDLIRSLLYDFRQWHALEATGRAGSDDGFDVRGWERVSEIDPAERDGDEPQEAIEAPGRQWLVQCKRESEIGPTKLAKYVLALPSATENEIYGLLFVASCDFSIKARNAFLAAARERGFQEAHLWSRSEIEDLLLQPKNDHLLFGFFGISLQIRQRSLRTQIRAKLATKREAKRKLPLNGTVLIRDVSDDRYPYLDRDKSAARLARGRWKPFTFRGCNHDGLRFLYRRHFAYLRLDGEAWDFAETMNDAPPGEYEDPWQSWRERDWADRSKAMELWDQLEPEEKGWFEGEVVLPYEAVLAIDEDGDEHFSGPHLFVRPFDAVEGNGPFDDRSWLTLETSGYDRRSMRVDDSKRVEMFPRDPEADKGRRPRVNV